MLNKYLESHSELYDKEHLYWIGKSLEALDHKHQLSLLHLEQVWILESDSRMELPNAIINSVNEITWDETEKFLASFYLESFLFQSRAYLDVFMYHSCLIFGVKNPGLMSREKFQIHMKRAQMDPIFSERAFKLSEYLKNKVFGKNQWGSQLKELRDKVAHFEVIRQINETSEKHQSGVDITRPAITGLTYEQLCQKYDNGVFDLHVKTAPILYLTEWPNSLEIRKILEYS